jgi:hypothetical protein
MSSGAKNRKKRREKGGKFKRIRNKEAVKRENGR